MPRVLLIDDSKTIHKVAHLILKGGLYKLTTAETAEDGERIALQEKPDIALVDLTIGADNGLDLIKKFSENPQLGAMKTALLHGHFQAVNDEMLKKAGGIGKLSKPFDPQEFIKLLEYLMNAEIPKVVASTPKVVDEVAAAPVTERAPEPQNIVQMPKDEFKSLFEEEELEDALNFLEKPLTSGGDSLKQPVAPIIKAADDSPKTQIAATDKVSRAMIEKVCWEVVPPLAERIIREEIQKLLKEPE